MCVGGQTPITGAPAGLEMQVERFGGVGPLGLEVLRGGDHHELAARRLRQVLASGDERERGLAGAGCGDREEVGVRSRAETVERGLLPSPQVDGPQEERCGGTASSRQPYGSPRTTREDDTS